MSLSYWIVACGLVGLFSLRRPWLVVGAAVATAVFVPYVAVPELTAAGAGSWAQVHPATWMVAVGFGVRVVLAPESVLRVWQRHGVVILLLGTATGLALWAQFSSGHTSGRLLIIDQLAAGWALVTLTLVAAADSGNRLRLEQLVLLLAVVQSLIAIAVWRGFIAQPFLASLSNQTWYRWIGSRQMGTMDHPLVLSMFLAASLALLPALRTALLQIAVGGVLLVGVLLTESRVGLLAAGLALLGMLFNARLSRSRKVALAALAVAGGLYVVGSAVASGVLARFSSDSGSTASRLRAYNVLLHRTSDFLLLGHGTGSSFDLAASTGLLTSFENGIVMYAIDYGLLMVLCLLGAVAYALFAKRPAPWRTHEWWAALIALGSVLSFSSIGVDTACGPLLWVFVALAAGASVLTGGSGGASEVAPAEAQLAAR